MKYFCLECMLEFVPKENTRGMYCSRSCSATANNKKRYKSKFCKFCKEEFFSLSRTKKFCSRAHAIAYTWENITKPKILEGNCSYRKTLQKFLIERDGDECSVCHIEDWDNKPITLQVDHTDGNPANNHPTNLRLICPNCHSQTKYFGGRNKGNGRKSRGLPR